VQGFPWLSIAVLVVLANAATALFVPDLG